MARKRLYTFKSLQLITPLTLLEPPQEPAVSRITHPFQSRLPLLGVDDQGAILVIEGYTEYVIARCKHLSVTCSAPIRFIDD